MGRQGHRLSEYIKLNEKKDKRLKKYKSKKVPFSLTSPDRLKVAKPWT
jgi:U3 small nucleolar RNA-associated protein 14